MQAATTTKEIGKTTSAMATVKCTGCQATKSTLEIGLIIFKAVSAHTSGLTKVMTTNFCAIVMWVIGEMVCDTEKEPSIIQMAASTKVIGLKTLKTDMESLLSKTVRSMTARLNKIGWLTARLASRTYPIPHPNKRQPRQILKQLKPIKKTL